MIEKLGVDGACCAAYIQFFLERLTRWLNEDYKAFVKASALAQKATDFILNRVGEPILQEK